MGFGFSEQRVERINLGGRLGGRGNRSHWLEAGPPKLVYGEGYRADFSPGDQIRISWHSLAQEVLELGDRLLFIALESGGV